ncbi:DUF72 domain-containing protein [Candidatus Bathyarchaeota archaeon]|nr:DUF72 domain-containing protein [Candidatus Bathyarchaeota archaeon]
MTEFFIGTGGWAYFKVPKINRLLAYSKAFNFVEVNSTFYKIPKMDQVKSWRKVVSKNFEFSVRCNKKLTHELKFESVPEAFKILEKMVNVCNTLKAKFLHFQTPPSFEYNKANSKKLEDFFLSIKKNNLQFVLETRNLKLLSSTLVNQLRDLEIIHCVDLLKGTKPAYHSEVLYTRLFGKGYHNIYQPLDSELKQIIHKASEEGIKKAVITMHSNKMFKDAARLKIYKESGIFPMVTQSTGVDSLIEVLKEDASFPINKSELISSQGWKIIDQTSKKRIRVLDCLQKLPEKTYYVIEDIIQGLGVNNFE